MKKTLALIGLVLVSCNAQKNVPATLSLQGDCPKAGTCKIELIKNKALLLKKDDFGRDYYEMAESAGTNIIKYIYVKTVKGDLQDAGYREEIVFEVEQKIDAVTATDKTLQSSKMLFGRFCFCKGQTGYYKVEKGNLTINGPKNKKEGILNFTVDEVPQVIKNIQFTMQ